MLRFLQPAEYVGVHTRGACQPALNFEPGRKARRSSRRTAARVCWVDLVIVEANVSLSSGNKSTGVSATALTIGVPVYYDTTASPAAWTKCDSDAAGKDAATGITLSNAAAAGQPITVQTDGVINLGAILTAGQTYIVSDTAGGIKAITLAGTGEKVCILGIATTTSLLKLGFLAGGTAHA